MLTQRSYKALNFHFNAIVALLLLVMETGSYTYTLRAEIHRHHLPFDVKGGVHDKEII